MYVNERGKRKWENFYFAWKESIEKIGEIRETNGKREKDRAERAISRRRVDDTGFATHGSIEVPFLEPIVRSTRSLGL